MGALDELSVKLYRAVMILPAAHSLQRFRDKVLRKKSSTYYHDMVPPIPHPIDREYGIETSGHMGFNALRSGKSSDIYTTSYGGSQPSILRKALQAIPDLSQSAFLDLGCGKGRAMAVATEFAFHRIVGVELAPSIVPIARANAERMRREFPDRTPIEVIEGDALATPIPEGQVVIFFYHPFFRALMKKIVAKLENALTVDAGRRIFVIYYDPVYGDLYDKSRRFQRFFAQNIEFEPFELGTGASYFDREDTVVIWQSRGANMARPHPGAEAKLRVIPPGWRAEVSQ